MYLVQQKSKKRILMLFHISNLLVLLLIQHYAHLDTTNNETSNDTVTSSSSQPAIKLPPAFIFALRPPLLDFFSPSSDPLKSHSLFLSSLLTSLPLHTTFPGSFNAIISSLLLSLHADTSATKIPFNTSLFQSTYLSSLLSSKPYGRIRERLCHRGRRPSPI